MNNKGQTLVIFVMILPIIVLGSLYIFLTLYSNYEKDNQKDIIKSICDYSKKENDITELIKFGNSNDNDQDISIKRIDNKIEVTLIKKGIFNIKIKTTTIC